MLTLLATLLLTFVVGEPAHASSTTRLRTATGELVSINAEKMFRDTEKKTMELSGGVQIIYDKQFLSCDRAIVNELSETIEASGNLVISSPQAYVEGDSAILSYKTNTGVIQNGFVKSGQVLFEGRVVHKTGPNTYDADQAKYTACTTCPTAWTFSGSRIRAEIGGYAYIKNSVLEVANVPVLWLPYLIVPLKSERQTGLLIPSFDYSDSGGAAIAFNFFWAINRSQDATITAKNYSKRGIKGLVDYRYVLTEGSEGELNAGYIHDRVVDGADEFQPVGNHANRWFMNYIHTYNLPNGVDQKVHLNFASDLRYPRDFPEELPGRGDPALENRISLTKNTEDTHASLDADYYINQLKSNPIDNNHDAVHRWPELKWSLAEHPLGDEGVLARTLFGINFDYVNFARDDYAFDDVEYVNGVKTPDPTRSNSLSGNVFNTDRDVVRAGQRFTIQPEISYPIHLFKVIDILPAANFKHTQYALNVAAPSTSSFEVSPYRQYAQTSLGMRTRFSKVYGERGAETAAPRPSVTNWVDAESRTADAKQTDLAAPQRPPNLYRHEIEPEIIFTGVPYYYQTERSPFLGTATQVPAFLGAQPISNSDFLTSDKGIQFDYEDRVFNRNTLGFAVSNRLVRKDWSDGTPQYKQIAYVRLGQSYDFDEARKTGQPTFPWSEISALIDIRMNHFDTNTTVLHFPYHNKTNTSSRMRVIDDHGRFLQLSVDQTYLITQKVEEAYNGRTEDVGLAAGLDSRYLTFSGSIDFQPVSWLPGVYQRRSWSTLLNIKPPGNCWGIRAGFRQDIGGEVTYKFDFDYNFGGAPAVAPAPPPPSTSS